jgi:hypothetical protein
VGGHRRRGAVEADGVGWAAARRLAGRGRGPLRALGSWRPPVGALMGAGGRWLGRAVGAGGGATLSVWSLVRWEWLDG